MSRRILAAVLVALAASGCGMCGRGVPPASPDVVAVMRASVPADPNDPAWAGAPVHTASLLLQDLVEPRLMTPSTAAVRVRAITDGTRVAFRLDWDDLTADDRPTAGHFVDACAIQVPIESAADLPAPQMGELEKSVEITYWRASWQAMVDGRGDAITDLFPNATVDHYPFDAASLPPGTAEQQAMASRYAPARALGNPMAGPRSSPVQNLVAHGPGTLEPGPSTDSSGHGRRLADGWAVVIARRLPAGVGPGGRGQIAFAVWEGSHDEAGARKMRTGWVTLVVEAAR
ncbi:MAG TPA: ethylbenzene dehydrogenase-related protein [Vicinamibacterales bacterium]|nr:ethylbenzene dehydrogenase-related protein [Vicinamibacterales bacterium]